MAFRRQDIPKTTRKTEDGQPRRLYPRFAKDRALLPKIELALGYLDGMVGRRRGDLSPDVVLELFGEPKLARCVLGCLADSYRYRTQAIAEVVGEEVATALAAWDLLTPADLRGHVYRAANARAGGFVDPATRDAFLTEVAEPLGLAAGQLEELLHLDAERNALLVRVGPRPNAEDVVARYNALLVVSILRHASEVTLELPGLDTTTIETVCSRHEVGWRRAGPEAVRLAGRRSAVGTWSQFGTRLARCALQLMLLAPRTPSGRSVVHLGDQPLAFAIDGFAVGAIRPKHRAVATADGVVRAAMVVDEVAGFRRKAGGTTNGWTMRRTVEPVVVDGAAVLPELTFVRDGVAIPLVPVPNGAGRGAALAAIERARTATPLLALGRVDGVDVPALATPDAATLIDLLEAIASGVDLPTRPLTVVEDEVIATGWVGTSRLTEVLGDERDLADRVRPLTAEGGMVLVPGFGLCRTGLLDELLDRLPAGPLDVAVVRAVVAGRVGDGPGANALTLHLLSRFAVVPIERFPEQAA